MLTFAKTYLHHFMVTIIQHKQKWISEPPKYCVKGVEVLSTRMQQFVWAPNKFRNHMFALAYHETRSYINMDKKWKYDHMWRQW